jgi:hypothetical protein
MGSKTNGAVCRLVSKLGTHELRPGGSLRVGRHAENDLQLPDTMVSRFHARFTWDARMDCPVVFDNGSQNGTTVDGKRVRNATPLEDGAKVVIGPYTFTAEMVGGADAGPAILKNTGEMVSLFSEDLESAELEGMAGSPGALRETLQVIERERRTGTLVLRLHGGERATMTYCLGRIMAATIPDGKGLRALERILTAPAASYRFRGEFEPVEDALNMWVSDYLRSRNLDGPGTQRFRTTTRVPRSRLE